KQVELLRGIAPRAAAFALLVNPVNTNAEGNVKDMEVAARALGWQMKVFEARTENDFETAFRAIAEQQLGALLIQDTALFNSSPERLAVLAASVGVPALSVFREFPSAGGLMSYGASRTDSGRQLAIYTGRILKGEKPANLPVIQPTKFELVINLKTAKSLGIDIPSMILAVADEVIE